MCIRDRLSPNPFNQNTILSFSNPNKQPCQLSLVNVEGKVIRTYQEVRTEEILIQRTGLASGVYFYQLSGDGFIYSGKMIVQ